MGRWTAADPAGLVDGLNLYRYSRDNPIAFNDATGTESNNVNTGDPTNPANFVSFESFEAANPNQPREVLLDVWTESRPAMSEAPTPPPKPEPKTKPGSSSGSFVRFAQGTPDDPIVLGPGGFIERQSQNEARQGRRLIQRQLQTLDNIRGGIIGTIAYALGEAASDDPYVVGAASDLGAIGDQVLTAPVIKRSVSPQHSTAPTTQQTVATQKGGVKRNSANRLIDARTGQFTKERKLPSSKPKSTKAERPNSPQIGKEGETTAGIDPSIPKRRIPSATGTAEFRIPDELTEALLREVKNVERLSVSGRVADQLKDLSAFAKKNKIKLILEVREDTKISKDSEDALKELGFELRRTLPSRRK